MYDGNVCTTVDYPGAVTTEIYDINDSGAAVGAYWTSTRSYGFLYDGNDFTTID